MITEVRDLKSVLKRAKHVLLVNDRIPPMFIAGPNIPLVNSVGLYRQLLRWRDEGVTHLQIDYAGEIKDSINDPWYKYYNYSNMLLSPSTRLRPLKLTNQNTI